MTLRGRRAGLPARPGLHQRAAGRRDQPHAAEDPGGAAGGDAGAPGDRRRRAAPAARPVPRGRHPEPDRVRGHLPAARGPARPLPRARSTSATPTRRRGARDARASRTAASRRRRSTTCSRSPARTSCAPRARAVDATEVTDEVVGYVVAHRAPHARAAERRARREPARRGAPARGVEGRGAAGRPRLRHARRRRAHGRRRSCATAWCSRPRPSSSASRPDDAVRDRAGSGARCRDEPDGARARRRRRASPCCCALARLSRAGGAVRRRARPVAVVALATADAGRRARRRPRGRAVRLRSVAGPRRPAPTCASTVGGRARRGSVRVRQPAPPDVAIEPRRGRRRPRRRELVGHAGAAGTTLPAGRGARHRAAGPRPAGTTRWRARPRGARVSRPPDAPGGWRSPVRPRAVPRPGARRARPARPRHRVRDRSATTNPTTTSARSTGARPTRPRAADEQPVPRRAGPRRACCWSTPGA